MNQFAHWLGKMWCVLAFLGFFSTPHAGAKDLPDVLIVVAGNQGWDELSMRGNPLADTPQLDALAASGMELTRFYATPAMATSYASLLTGRYHYRTGVAGDEAGEHVMNAYETTLGEMFGDGEYRTGFFGPWKNGENWPHCAEAQGFGTVLEGADSESVQAFFGEEDASPRMALWACESFALADARMGELKALLSRENFLLVYLAASGPDPDGEIEHSNARLYGDAGSVHEGGIRVPCFISYPAKISKGSRFGRITSVIDLFPTLASICELDLPEDVELDGTDLSPALFSGGEPRRWPNRILLTSMTPPGFDLKNAAASVRTDRWLAVRDPVWCRDKPLAAEFNGWELYDLVADPFERFNVSTDYPYLISDMTADFSFWMDQTTRFGLKPIPSEIGHPEWPTVTLPKSLQNQEGEWPVRVVDAGKYRVELDGEPVGNLIVNGEMKTYSGAIGLNEVVTSISCSPDGRSGWEILTLTRHDK